MRCGKVAFSWITLFLLTFSDRKLCLAIHGLLHVFIALSSSWGFPGIPKRANRRSPEATFVHISNFACRESLCTPCENLNTLQSRVQATQNYQCFRHEVTWWLVGFLNLKSILTPGISLEVSIPAYINQMFQTWGDMWVGWVLPGEVFILLLVSLLTLGAPLGIEDLVKCKTHQHCHHRKLHKSSNHAQFLKSCSDTSGSISRLRSAQ